MIVVRVMGAAAMAIVAMTKCFSVLSLYMLLSLLLLLLCFVILARFMLIKTSNKTAYYTLILLVSLQLFVNNLSTKSHFSLSRDR